MFVFLFFLVAFILFVVAAVRSGFDLTSLGLAFLSLAFVIQTWPGA